MTQFKYEFRIPNSRIYPHGRENDGLDEKDLINYYMVLLERG